MAKSMQLQRPPHLQNIDNEQFRDVLFEQMQIRINHLLVLLPTPSAINDIIVPDKAPTAVISCSNIAYTKKKKVKKS